MGSQSGESWLADAMVRAVIGVIVALTALTLAGLFSLGQSDPLLHLPWFVPTMQAFAAIAGLAVAVLSLARYRTLGGPWNLWAGLTFLAGSVLGVFYILAWPELLGDGQGVISHLPNTASWLRELMYVLFLPLFGAALARRPTALRAPVLLAASALTVVSVALVGLLSVKFEEGLPAMAVAGAFTPPTLILSVVLSVLYTASAAALLRRYLAAGDPFLGYLALFLALIVFQLLYEVIGGARYTLWWYAGRSVYVLAHLVLLFGLLQEGYVLYSRERVRSHYLAVLNELSRALGTAAGLEQVNHVAVEAASHAVGASMVALISLNEDSNRPSLSASVGLSQEIVDHFSETLDDEGRAVAQIADSQRPVAGLVGEAPPALVEPLRRAGDEGFRHHPRARPARGLGVLLLGRRSPRTLAEEEIQLLLSMADRLGGAVETAHLYERVRGVNERLALTILQAQDLAEQAQQHAGEMEAVIESIAEGATIVDAEGRLVRLNRVGRELWGWANADAIPGVPEQFHDGVDLRLPSGQPLPPAERPLSRALRGETFANLEVVYFRPDGQRLYLLFAGSVVRDGEGRVRLAVNVYRDITTIREMERQREEFISVVAHDLRGAMTTVKGHADLMMRPAARQQLPERVQRGLEAISTGSRHMERMVNDLLDASRIQARRLHVEKETVSLVPLLLDVVQRTEELTKGHPVRVEVRGEVPPLQADPGRLEQVVTNLLSNAAKYSYPESQIELLVERRPDEVVISVTNLGTGVLLQDRDALFTRFYRTQQAQFEKVPGLGLGLYIARGLVEAHGGRIWVESEPGKYATFRFVLPT